MGEMGRQAEDGGWAQQDGKKGKRLQSSWKCVACRQRWEKPASESKKFEDLFIRGRGYLV